MIHRTLSNPDIWHGMILERERGLHMDPAVNNSALKRLYAIETALRSGSKLENIPEFQDWSSIKPWTNAKGPQL